MKRTAAAASRRLLHSVAARQQAAPWLLPAAASGTWSVVQPSEGCRAAPRALGSLAHPAGPTVLPRQARGLATAPSNDSGPMRQFRQAPRAIPLPLPPPPTGGLPPPPPYSPGCSFTACRHLCAANKLQAGSDGGGHQGVRAGAVVRSGGAASGCGYLMMQR